MRHQPEAPTSERRVGRLWKTITTALVAVFLATCAVTVFAQEEDIDFMPGRLSLAHEGLEDPDGCDNCHDDDLNVDGNRCLVCHDQIAGSHRGRTRAFIERSR